MWLLSALMDVKQEHVCIMCCGHVIHNLPGILFTKYLQWLPMDGLDILGIFKNCFNLLSVCDLYYQEQVGCLHFRRVCYHSLPLTLFLPFLLPLSSPPP